MKYVKIAFWGAVLVLWALIATPIVFVTSGAIGVIDTYNDVVVRHRMMTRVRQPRPKTDYMGGRDVAELKRKAARRLLDKTTGSNEN